MCCSHVGLQRDGAPSLFRPCSCGNCVRVQKPARNWPKAMDSAEDDTCRGSLFSADQRSLIYLVWQKLESPAHAIARGPQPICTCGWSRSREALLVFRPASHEWLVRWTASRPCLSWALHEL